MDTTVSILKLTSAMARHATFAHKAAAQNIARADVPEATGRSVIAFEKALRALERGRPPREIETSQAINLEKEILSTVQTKGRHDAAITFWKSGLKMMRLAVGAPQR